MIKWFLYVLLLESLVSCKHNSKKHGHFYTYDIVFHKDNHIPNKEASEYFEKGLQYVDKGNYENAKNAFIKADHACPNMPVILNAIGNTIIETEIPEDAMPYYEKALKVDSTFIKTYINFGCCLNSMRNYERAKHIFYLGLARPITYKTDRRALFLDLANSYYFEREYTQALAFLDSAKAGPSHDQIYDAAEEAERHIRTNLH